MSSTELLDSEEQARNFAIERTVDVINIHGANFLQGSCGFTKDEADQLKSMEAKLFEEYPKIEDVPRERWIEFMKHFFRLKGIPEERAEKAVDVLNPVSFINTVASRVMQ